MILNGLVIAVATLAVGLVLAYGLRSLPTMRVQLAGLAALAVGLPLASVLLSGWVMFHMGDDVKILAVAAASAAVAVVAGLFLAEAVVRPTISALHWRTCGRCSRRPRTSSSRPTTTFPHCTSRCACSRSWSTTCSS